MEVQVLTVSSKGQIALPISIRKSLGINTGDLLAAYESGDAILLKPINMPSDDDIKRALDAAQTFARENALTEDDIKEAIKEYRKEKHK